MAFNLKTYIEDGDCVSSHTLSAGTEFKPDQKKSYLKERKENNLSKAAPQISVWTDADAFPLLTRK